MSGREEKKKDGAPVSGPDKWAQEILEETEQLKKQCAALEAAFKKEKEEELKPRPGQMIASQGVFLGQYAPKDRDGNSLGRVFNVFAAPQDLTDKPGKNKTYKYGAAVKTVAKLKGWNGFDGTNYATDKEIYKALKDGSYDGGWIIPTRDILHGKDVDGKDTTPDNILAHKDKGSFKGTFKMAASSGSVGPGWYWSSTKDRDFPSDVWCVRLSDGLVVCFHNAYHLLSCRPVRLVEVPASRLGAG